MYKLLNAIFGWDYVWIKDCEQSHVCRVNMIPNGDLRGVIVSKHFFITKEGDISGGYNIQDWTPLTFTMERKHDHN